MPTVPKLTDAIAAGFEPPAGKTEDFLWDGSLPGFACRARRSGTEVSRTWYCQYRANRRQRRESLGDIRRVKNDAARKIARQRFAAVELGSDPAADRDRARSEAAAIKTTVGNVVERYLRAKKAEMRPATYKAAERYFKVHFAPLSAAPITAITRAEVATVLQDIAAERGRVAAARARANLAALFSWTVREGLLEQNVVANTNKPDAGVRSRERVLDDGELRAIWQNLENDDFGKIIRLLILLGCRRSEIGDLKWSEIDLDVGVMTISGTRVKNHRTLVLQLPGAALEILRAVPRRQGAFVFGKGTRGFCTWGHCKQQLDSRITNALGQSLPAWRVHDVRRTCRTGLGKIGVPPHVAEMVIGHAKGGIVAVYDRHTYGAEIKTALLRWSEHIATILEDRQSNVVSWRT
jgi:integrase